MSSQYLAALKALIDAHPEITAGSASDSQVADALNALTVPSSTYFYVQSRTILAVTGPVVHKALMAAIRASYPDLVTILEQVGPNNGTAGGMDINRPDVQAFLSSLVGEQTGLTQEMVDQLIAFSKIRVSMATASNLPAITHTDVALANGTAQILISPDA